MAKRHSPSIYNGWDGRTDGIIPTTILPNYQAIYSVGVLSFLVFFLLLSFTSNVLKRAQHTQYRVFLQTNTGFFSDGVGYLNTPGRSSSRKDRCKFQILYISSTIYNLLPSIMSCILFTCIVFSMKHRISLRQHRTPFHPSFYTFPQVLPPSAVATFIQSSERVGFISCNTDSDGSIYQYNCACEKDMPIQDYFPLCR